MNSRTDIEMRFSALVEKKIRKTYGKSYTGSEEFAPWNNKHIIESFQKVLVWKNNFKKYDVVKEGDIFENESFVQSQDDYVLSTEHKISKQDIPCFLLWFKTCSDSEDGVRAMICKNIIKAKTEGINTMEVLEEISKSKRSPLEGILYAINHKENFKNMSFADIKRLFAEKRDIIVQNFSVESLKPL